MYFHTISVLFSALVMTASLPSILAAPIPGLDGVSLQNWARFKRHGYDHHSGATAATPQKLRQDALYPRHRGNEPAHESYNPTTTSHFPESSAPPQPTATSPSTEVTGQSQQLLDAALVRRLAPPTTSTVAHAAYPTGTSRGSAPHYIPPVLIPGDLEPPLDTLPVVPPLGPSPSGSGGRSTSGSYPNRTGPRRPVTRGGAGGSSPSQSTRT